MKKSATGREKISRKFGEFFAREVVRFEDFEISAFGLSSKRGTLFLLQIVAKRLIRTCRFTRILSSQFLELSKLFQVKMNLETRRYHANEFIKEVSKFHPRELIYNRMNRVVRERTEVFTTVYEYHHFDC